MNKVGLAILATISLFACLGIMWLSNINYTITVGEYLKRAADANSVELALANLETAISKIETNGWTSGNTSVLWVSPKNDIGFWYQNLTSARDELTKLDPAATPLEKTNVLMKLRESLLEGSGTSVTAPDGIALYPRNALFFYWGWVSALVAVGLWGWWFVKEQM